MPCQRRGGSARRVTEGKTARNCLYLFPVFAEALRCSLLYATVNDRIDTFTMTKSLVSTYCDSTSKDIVLALQYAIVNTRRDDGNAYEATRNQSNHANAFYGDRAVKLCVKWNVCQKSNLSLSISRCFKSNDTRRYRENKNDWPDKFYFTDKFAG
ncbi:hypothetical protein PUN28_019216 [Cardiocondyla obscurior]|uniref:Uncharacterized protein n=1 Tax=Cardiocondyla obscurior TaxID=286306 RepID=A0AAW2EEP5_9HYME